MSLELLGVDHVGLDPASFGSIFQAAGELAKGGISLYETDKAEKKASADDKAKLAAAVAADIAASTAAAKAESSVQTKAASAEVDKAAAEAAGRAQGRAGAALPPALAPQRAEAAEKQLAAATALAQKNPKAPYAVALMKAWTATVNKANNTQISTADAVPKASEAGESWLTKPAIGPVPGWGVAAGGVGLMGILGLVLKRVLS